MKKIIFFLPLLFLFSCSSNPEINEKTVYFVESDALVPHSFSFYKKSSGIRMVVLDSTEMDFGKPSRYSGGLTDETVEISNDSVYVKRITETSKNKYGESDMIEEKKFLARIDDNGILNERDLTLNLNKVTQIQEKVTKITIKSED